MPLVQAALKQAGIPTLILVARWTTQVFWTFLDWVDIIAFVTLSLVFGVDFSLYMCAAILYHLEPKILDHSVAGDLGEYLLVNSIEGFTVSGYFTFMMRLRDKYHNEFVSEATHNNVNLS